MWFILRRESWAEGDGKRMGMESSLFFVKVTFTFLYSSEIHCHWEAEKRHTDHSDYSKRVHLICFTLAFPVSGTAILSAPGLFPTFLSSSLSPKAWSTQGSEFGFPANCGRAYIDELKLTQSLTHAKSVVKLYISRKRVMSYRFDWENQSLWCCRVCFQWPENKSYKGCCESYTDIFRSFRLLYPNIHRMAWNKRNVLTALGTGSLRSGCQYSEGRRPHCSLTWWKGLESSVGFLL